MKALLNKLKALWRFLNKPLKILNKQIREHIDELERFRLVANEEIKTLEEKLKELSSVEAIKKKAEAEVDELDAANNELLAQLDDKAIEIVNLEQEHSEQVAELQSKIDELKESEDELKKKLSSMFDQVTHVESRSLKLEKDKTHLINQLQTKNNLFSQEAQRAEKVTANQAAELQALKSELKIKDDIFEQDKKMIESLQEQLDELHTEQQEFVAKNERLSAQLRSMTVCIMDKKDAQGRVFARIAPLIDKDGYEKLLNGEGRMQLKVSHVDGTKQIVYLERGE